MVGTAEKKVGLTCSTVASLTLPAGSAPGLGRAPASGRAAGELLHLFVIDLDLPRLLHLVFEIPHEQGKQIVISSDCLPNRERGRAHPGVGARHPLCRRCSVQRLTGAAPLFDIVKTSPLTAVRARSFVD